VDACLLRQNTCDCEADLDDTRPGIAGAKLTSSYLKNYKSELKFDKSPSKWGESDCQFCCATCSLSSLELAKHNQFDSLNKENQSANFDGTEKLADQGAAGKE
jgi:hypothetical protein